MENGMISAMRQRVWVIEFERLWLAWVHAGCRRDADGKPILPEAQKVKVPA